jgi:BioD-like phosphotransacetylase family protein
VVLVVAVQLLASLKLLASVLETTADKVERPLDKGLALRRTGVGNVAENVVNGGNESLQIA